jgi:hypothetical protein
MNLRRFSCLAVWALLVTACGCGHRELSNNDEVEGIVTLDGVPLPGVSVEFSPAAFVPKRPVIRSHAITDEHGRFTLIRTDDRSGAAISEHRVTVFPAKSGPGANVPEVYWVGGTTPLFVDVIAGEHSYELKLTKDAKSSGAREPGD